MNTQQAFALALQRHRAGHLAEAEEIYRRILSAQPDHAEALHHLGIVAQQVGRHELAIDLIRRAIALAPDNPAAHSNLGIALAERNRFEEAMAAYGRALQLRPDSPEVYLNLGNLHRMQGQTEAAIACYRRTLQRRPDMAEASNNLGTSLAECGQLDEAIAAYQRAIQLRPTYPEAHNNLGNVLRQRGQLEEAVGLYREAIRLAPDYAEAHNHLGLALTEHGPLREALPAYRRALQLQPDYAEAHGNLGIALAGLGMIDEAVAAHRRALEIKPDYANGYNNLGHAFKEQGRIDEAIAAYRQGLRLQPQQPGVHSNLVYALHFRPGGDDVAVGVERRLWNQRFGEPMARFFRAHSNDRDPERRLRVGYVSPEFRDHVTGRYLVPLFENHDSQNFEVLCYAGVVKPDLRTNGFQQRADRWRSTVGVADETLADIIREDRVDILVDLTQHLAGNRLPVFARRPAPVQVSFAGYPESTGLEAIGNRISDRYLESKMEDGRSEIGGDLPDPISDLRPAEQVFLIDTFWCYDPCGIEAPLNASPARANGRVTFGCLNNFCKINEPVLRLWARLLREVEDSRLILLSAEGSHRRWAGEILERAGVKTGRLEFAAPCSRQAYLELYHRLDIVLDPFPYNGHTTSLDALWMGVPVVSLVGGRPVARAGLSQLSNLDLPGWLAYSEDDYVRIAAALAGDFSRLAEWRSTLRPRLQMSPLMDAPRFARGVEGAYELCGGNGVRSSKFAAMSDSRIQADPWNSLRAHTAARIALGRSGGSLPTRAQLEFRLAHACARDAVLAEFDADALGARLQALGEKVMVVESGARDRAEFLQRPDLGRQFGAASRATLAARAGETPQCDIAIIVSDGLSTLAANTQAEPLLAALLPRLRAGGWKLAPLIVARHARVALQDEIGAILGAQISLMLLGERPGLGNADSLGAYFTYGPALGRTDADRNCISNIRPGGLAPEEAAHKLHALLVQARRLRLSGVALKDETGLGDRPGDLSIGGHEG